MIPRLPFLPAFLIGPIAVAFVTLGVVLSSGSARAEWKGHFEQAQQLMADKDFRAAESAALEALAEADVFGATDDRRIQTLRLLADIYRESRQWAASAQLLEQVIEAYKKTGVDQSPDASNVWNRLGVVYQQMKAFDKAEAAYESSLTIKRKKFKQNVASIAVVVTNLGELYRRQKKWEKAEALHKSAIEDKENELGPEHPTLVASLNDLALVYREQKRWDEAKPLLERARTLAQKGENGGRNADHATALANLADVMAAKSDNATAKTLYEEALSMRKEVLGGQHPHVAETLNNFANLLLSMNQPADAIPMYDQAIEIRKQEFGASDATVTTTMKNKAMALDRLGKKDEAAKVREEVKALEFKRSESKP